jgi:DNA repair exonuclease SbcCD ATPase subunit
MTAQHLASKAGDVAERHDLQRARAQREAAADAQRQLEALDPRLANARSRCAEAERDLALAREAHESAKKEASEARQAVALAEAALEREAEALERTRGALPPLAAPHADDPEQGVVALESSRSEIAELVALAECLADAEAHAVTLDGEIRRLTKEQDATPEAARRPATEVESEIADADAERSRLQGERAAASARLERRRPLLTRLAELDDARATAAANARRYRRLSSLLGRQGLQRALIRRAEAVIADHAASLLDHLSGGRLDLRLRSQTGTADKALDLVALDRDTGGRPLPVASLSGSQKFRVAVALALAIGRYASEAGRPIRAVVIDEGFGGLDAEGLDAMADALHDLQSVLDRVLLVSHQPDFSAHFPNRYAVALHDGASVVSTADPTA